MEKISDYFREDLKNQIFSAQLYEMFAKKDDAVKEYIKVGRKFWHFDRIALYWRKLTVVYIRTGVMFFTFDDEPNVEHAWFMGSFDCLMLHAAEIHPKEIAKILPKYCPYLGAGWILDASRECKWDDCDGDITVDVIWD